MTAQYTVQVYTVHSTVLQCPGRAQNMLQRPVRRGVTGAAQSELRDLDHHQLTAPPPPLIGQNLSIRALIGAKSRGDNVMECPQPAGYSSRNNASKGWTFSAGNKCDILAIFAIFHPCEARWWAQCGNIRLGPGLAVTSDHPRHIWCNVWCGTGAQTGDYQKTQDLLKCFPSSVGEKKGIKRLIKQSIVRILEPENSKRSR